MRGSGAGLRSFSMSSSNSSVALCTGSVDAWYKPRSWFDESPSAALFEPCPIPLDQAFQSGRTPPVGILVSWHSQFCARVA